MNHGILLLSGGRSQRMGSPKQALAHPSGGSWGAHLIWTFTTVFPRGASCILGDALPDLPHLPRLEDPRRGPAAALGAWALARAAEQVPSADRWWVVGCDQVRWTPERLDAWASASERADPAGAHWVIAEYEQHLQPLGGWLPEVLCPNLAISQGGSLIELLKTLPHLVLPGVGEEWRDVDTPEERQQFEEEANHPPIQGSQPALTLGRMRQSS